MPIVTRNVTVPVPPNVHAARQNVSDTAVVEVCHPSPIAVACGNVSLVDAEGNPVVSDSMVTSNVGEPVTATTCNAALRVSPAATVPSSYADEFDDDDLADVADSTIVPVNESPVP